MLKLAIVIACLAGGASAQTTGAQLASYHSTVDDSEQPYALYVPTSFNPAKKYPLVITLHDEDSNHRLNLRRIFGVATRGGEPDTENMRYFPKVPDTEFLVAAPFARGSMGYQGIAERDVYDVLADVERRFPVDPDRVYLTGISMGGAGALWLAASRPDQWAAVAVLCPANIPGNEDLAVNFLNLPVRLYHGDLDPVVPVEISRAWQRRLLDQGAPVSYIDYPGVRHNVWDHAYRNGAILQWFAGFRRNHDPERVTFTTASYRYNSAYWIRIDGLTPGMQAFIDASWTSKSELHVTTRNVDAFTAIPGTGHGTAVQVTIDGAPVPVKGATLSFVRTPTGWRQGAFTPPAKHSGAEGPIAEAVSGRQLYVYGTTGAATPADIDARRKLAETAAHWSTIRQKISFNPAVKADTAVSAVDLDQADLILFGTPETNSVLAHFTARLPLALSSAAPDYGLLFIAPIGKHYALVSSGLPWWTGADEANRGGYPLAPPSYRLLTTFGDYILFKGGLGNVVAEGRFDANWRVPAEAAGRIAASGTVSVR